MADGGEGKRSSDRMKIEIILLDFSLGEIYELKAELNSDKRERKKEAVKKVTEY